MKRFLFLFSLLIVGLSSWAQSGHETTTDHMSISTLELSPGGIKGYFVVSIVGTQKYTACGMDIIVPVGYEFDLKSDGTPRVSMNNEEKNGMFPVTNQEEVDEEDADPVYGSHTVDCNISSQNTLTVTSWSTKSTEYASNSGKIFRVYIKATSYAKPGPAAIQIKNCFFTTSAGVQYDTQDITISDKVSASTSASASLTISATNQWSTCVLPFATELPDGVKAYKYSSMDSEKVIFTKVNSIEAYKPYLVYAENGYTGTVSGTADAANYPVSGQVVDGNFHGAIQATTIGVGNYIMQNQGDGAKFHQIAPNSEFVIPAGKCWLAPNNGGGAKALIFDIEEESTDITNVLNKTCDEDEYNLMGIKVKDAKKGTIVIKGGKKVIK